jgi:hypothetical protein
MADDQALSSLYVMLGLDTVNFEAGADRASKIADNTAGNIDKSFASISEGRGGLMLTEDALGFRLPRHLNNLLAKMPGVATAFSAILPIAGVVVAIDVIGKLIAKHDEAIQKAREQAQAWSAFTDKLNDNSDALQTENDKLRNTIAIYGGKSPNLVKVALDEAVVAADKLYGGLKKDIEELEKLEQATHVSLFKQMMGDAGDAAEEMQPFLDGILKVEAASKKAIATAKESGDAKQVEAAQTKADADVQLAYGNAITKTADLWNKSHELMNKGIGTFTHNAKGQIIIIQDQTARMTQLGKVSDELKDQMHNAALGADHMALSLKVGLEDPAKSAKKLQEANEALARSNKELGDAENKEAASKALLALSGVKVTADVEAQITAIKVAATKQQYSNDMQAAVQHLNIVTQTAGATKSQIEVAQNAIIAMAANFQTKMNDEQIAGNNKRFTEQEEADKKQAELTQKIGAENLKFTEEMSKLNLDEQKKTEDELVRTNQVTAAQDTANRLGFEKQNYKIVVDGIAATRAAISADDADQAVKQLALDHKLEEEQKRHEAAMNGIVLAAEQKKAQDITAAENKIGHAIAETAAKSIVQSKNMGDAFKALGKQMMTAALTSLLELETVEGRKKLVKAKSAASGAYTGVMDMDLPPMIGFPLAIGSAAAAFAGVMAFEQGGVVPHDAMAMVHKNEMVLPPHIAQAILASSGAGGGTHHYHVDARGADAGVEQRVTRAMQAFENRAVARSISAVNDRAGRR